MKCGGDVMEMCGDLDVREKRTNGTEGRFFCPARCGYSIIRAGWDGQTRDRLRRIGIARGR